MRDQEWQIHGEEVTLLSLLGGAKELAIDELHRRLADEGFADIRPGHGCVFRFVEVEGSRLTEMASRAGMTKQSVGEVVTDLERLGYVERVPDPDDRRAKIIRLSERGWDAERAAKVILADIERRWAREVGEERVAELRRTIEAVLSAAQVPA